VRAGWVLAALVLIEHAVVTIEFYVRAGDPHAMILPLLALGSMGVMLALLALSPGWMTAFAYLAVGAVAIAAYLSLISEQEGAEDIVLIGTAGSALCFVGAVTGGALGGAAWTLVGVATTHIALISTQLSLGNPPQIDQHALMMAFLYASTYYLLWRSDRMQRGLVSTAPIQAEVRREEYERQRERRAAVVVHETVLRDLALIAHGPLQLTDFDRVRLQRDLDEITAWRSPAPEEPLSSLPRDDFYDIIRDFQWRGLSVDVGGNSYALEMLATHDRDALLGAMRAALDNVLEHSGESTAEIFIDQGPDRLTVMVVDEGHGFAMDRVASDRLGLRMAIIRRIEDHGGSVTVWASPGAGTSVVMSLPLDVREGIYA
jgi:hypothetical protein